MQLRHDRRVISAANEVQSAVGARILGRTLHVGVQREIARQRDVALQQVGDLLHVEVPDGQVEVRAPLRGQQPVRIDARRGPTAQLEIDHLDPASAPPDLRRVRALPGGRVEVQRHVGKPQLVAGLIQCEIAVQRIVAPRLLLDVERNRAAWLEVRQIARHAVECEAERADRVPREGDGHPGLRGPGILPTVGRRHMAR
jgi:hypothetical protein